MAKKVVVYTGEQCPFCVRAKQLLKERGIAFEEVKLGWDDEAGWDALVAKSGMQTVPQIFADEVLIGGFSELSAQDKKDGLSSLK